MEIYFIIGLISILILLNIKYFQNVFKRKDLQTLFEKRHSALSKKINEAGYRNFIGEEKDPENDKELAALIEKRAEEHQKRISKEEFEISKLSSEDKINLIKFLLEKLNNLKLVIVRNGPLKENLENIELYPKEYIDFLKEVGSLLIYSYGINGDCLEIDLQIPATINDPNFEDLYIWPEIFEEKNQALHLARGEEYGFIEEIKKDNFALIGFDVHGDHYGFTRGKSGRFEFTLLRDVSIDLM